MPTAPEIITWQFYYTNKNVKVRYSVKIYPGARFRVKTGGSIRGWTFLQLANWSSSVKHAVLHAFFTWQMVIVHVFMLVLILASGERASFSSLNLSLCYIFYFTRTLG